MRSTTGDTQGKITPVLGGEELPQLQRLVRRLPAPPSLVSYAVALVRCTRLDAPEATLNPEYRFGTESRRTLRPGCAE